MGGFFALIFKLKLKFKGANIHTQILDFKHIFHILKVRTSTKKIKLALNILTI